MPEKDTTKAEKAAEEKAAEEAAEAAKVEEAPVMTEAEEDAAVKEELERLADQEETEARERVRARASSERSRSTESDGVERVVDVKARSDIPESGDSFGPYDTYVEVVTFRGTFGLKPGEVLEVFPLKAAKITPAEGEPAPAVAQGIDRSDPRDSHVVIPINPEDDEVTVSSKDAPAAKRTRKK